MALQDLSTGHHVKAFPDFRYLNTSKVLATLDATNEKAAWIFKAPLTGDINKLFFAVATVSSAQDLKVSLQGVNASGEPDGVIKGTSNVAFGVITPTSATLFVVTLNGVASVTANDSLAVVVEFNSTVGGVTLDFDTDATTLMGGYDFYVAFCNTSNAWTKTASMYLACGIIYSIGGVDVIRSFFGQMTPRNNGVTAVTSFNSGSVADEVGNRFKSPLNVQAIGAYLKIDADNGADVVLYDAEDTVVGSFSISTTQRYGTSAGNHHGYFTGGPVEITPGVYYRLVIKPTTTSNVSYSYVNFWSGETELSLVPFGGNICKTSRADAGAWTEDSNDLIIIGLLIDAIDRKDGNSGRGGPVAAGMTGGLLG